jgi:hypothetical protein
MDLLDLHARLAGMTTDQRRELLDGNYWIQTERGRADIWPAVVSAAVILSGTIATIESDRDIAEAVDHFKTLLSIEVLDEAAWRAEVNEVLDELLRWGDAADVPLAARN